MNLQERKQQIIADYYLTNRLKAKIDSICFKWYVTRNSKIAEDIEAEVWYHLSNYNPEKLCAVYDQTGTIEGLAVTIAKYQFRFRKENPQSPNNSFGTKLLFGSTFHNINNISATDTYNDDDSTSITLYDGSLFEETSDADLWLKIKERLTDTEVVFIDELLAGIKHYKRKPTNAYKAFKAYVFTKIKNMNINKPLTTVEQIKTKLDMMQVNQFDVMFDEDLTLTEKITKLGYSKNQYLAQRRILLKKIKALNIK